MGSGMAISFSNPQAHIGSHAANVTAWAGSIDTLTLQGEKMIG
jgi:hypothetical protein